MSNLLFPNLKEVSLQAASALLLSYELNTPHHPILHDFGYLLSEFFQQLKIFSNKGGDSYTYDELTDRSQILIKWVDLLLIQFRECTSHLSKEFNTANVESDLNHIRTIYSHPLLTSIWLGLEGLVIVNNTKLETEFLQYIRVVTHYDQEVSQQLKKCLSLISDAINMEDSIKAISDLVANKTVVDKLFMEKFISLSAPLLFQMAALGKMDLVSGAIETYNYFLTYLDNIRLKNDYRAAIERIQRKIPKRYEYAESIYAEVNPLFDTHIAKTANYINKDKIENYFLPIKDVLPLPSDIQAIFTKLESNIDYICMLRGRLIGFKSRNYVYQLHDVLYQSVLPHQKAHTIELLTSGWYGWVKKSYPGESIIVNECLSLAGALATKIRDQAIPF